MANYYSEVPELKFHLNNPMMERICELKERNLDAEIAELERRSAKRQMTLERVSRREKRNTMRNRDDREEMKRDLHPHRRQLH